MNIMKGIQNKPLKIVVYGPEGIGKTTFASRFPDPLFIDTEGSTARMDVARTETPSSLAMLTAQLTEIRDTPPAGFKTLVLDTIDWAERLCIRAVCEKAGKSGIEDFGYGKGYSYVFEEMGLEFDTDDESEEPETLKQDDIKITRGRRSRITRFPGKK